VEKSVAGAPIDPNAVYSLGSNPAESARLQRQADELDRQYRFARTDCSPVWSKRYRPGLRTAGCVDLLAAGVAPGGRVVGLDADPAHTADDAEAPFLA
jgi:hypothetical protein